MEVKNLRRNLRVKTRKEFKAHISRNEGYEETVKAGTILVIGDNGYMNNKIQFRRDNQTTNLWVDKDYLAACVE